MIDRVERKVNRVIVRGRVADSSAVSALWCQVDARA
jgi:hypothetical protein